MLKDLFEKISSRSEFIKWFKTDTLVFGMLTVRKIVLILQNSY